MKALKYAGLHDNGFLIVLIANFLFFFNFSELMLLPRYFVELGAAPAELGRLMGIFSLVVVVVLPIIGHFSDRICRRNLFVAGSLLLSLSTFAFGLLSEISSLSYILRALQGVAFASAFGISGALVYDVAGAGNSRRLLGVLTVSNISTHALGPIFGELIMTTLGFGWFFMTAAAFGLVAALLGMKMPSRIYPSESGRPKGGAFRFVAADFIVGLIFGAVIIFIPPYMLLLGLSHTSVFFTAFVGGSLLMWAMLFSRMDRIDERLMWAGSVMLVILLPLFMPHDGYAGLVVLAVLFGLGYGYLYPSLNSYIIDAYSQNLRGFANSVFVWTFNLGMLGASLGGGYLIGAVGYIAALRWIAAGGLLLLPVALSLRSAGRET